MSACTPRIGIWAALLSVLFAACFNIVALAANFTMLIPAIWVNPLSFAPSLLLAWSSPVVNDGSDINTNAHLMTQDAGVPRFRESRGHSYGVDIVKLDALGLRARDVLTADPKAYAIYGARVLAPCAGRIVLAVDGLPDLQVPAMDRVHMAGNHILLRCAEVDVLIGHMSPGSVHVRVGEVVATGGWLGAVGNICNTGEPHLHVHAQRPGSAGAPIGGGPLPIMFNGHFLVRGDRIGSP